MTRGDIIGGLKIALSRGEKLRQAMQSFYNAGYKKEDIINAAKTLKTQGFVPNVVRKPLPQQTKIKIKNKSQTKIPVVPVKPKVVAPAKPKPKIPEKTKTALGLKIPPPAAPKETQTKNQTKTQMPQQTVSAYAQPAKNKTDFMTIMLAVILLLLIGVLVGVFFFKESIISFLNSVLN